MARLDLIGIEKRFGAVEVLRDVNLSIADGEFIVLVGPSGCGKSTLLRMIAGLEDISAGEFQIDGQRMNEVAPRDRDIAMVFQSYALYPHMDVARNMGFSMEIRGAEAAARTSRVAAAARTLGLDKLTERLPRALSGGQRQRVAMGRAIVRQPQVFLFDEPLSNLDAKLRAQTRLEIQKLHRDLSITSLFVTHDQVEAMTLAQRMMVMNAGNMEQFGTPEEVYQRPATTFVAGFIGSPQMNFLKSGALGQRGETIGVRPEHIAIARDTGRIAGHVSHVEKLGGETLVYVRTEAHGLLTVRLFGEHDYAVDETVHLTPDDRRSFHFDAAGLRLR